MNIQADFSMDSDAIIVADETARSTGSLYYITDLLAELHTIASLSGLSELSDDLVAVISKHVSGTAKAA